MSFTTRPSRSVATSYAVSSNRSITAASSFGVIRCVIVVKPTRSTKPTASVAVSTDLRGRTSRMRRIARSMCPVKSTCSICRTWPSVAIARTFSRATSRSVPPEARNGPSMFTWNIETAASAIRASDEPTTRTKRLADGAPKSCDAVSYDSNVTESSSL